MRYRPLGRTGIQVSPYALGALMFATSMGNAPEESARIIHKALNAGINLIDTADAYGDSEEVVGKALGAIKARRDDIVVATKFGRPTGQDPNWQGASRRWIRVTTVENSLRRLQTDRIDLYQLHRPDPDTDIEETLSALTDLVRGGKVRAIGASGTPASDIVDARWVAQRRGLERFSTEQPVYSLLNRGIEREVLPTIQRFGMGALVWARWARACSPAACARTRPATYAARAWLRHLDDEQRLDVVEQLVPLAAEAGLPMTHLAMAFRYRPPRCDQPTSRRKPHGSPGRAARRNRRGAERKNPRPHQPRRPTPAPTSAPWTRPAPGRPRSRTRACDADPGTTHAAA